MRITYNELTTATSVLRSFKLLIYEWLSSVVIGTGNDSINFGHEIRFSF